MREKFISNPETRSLVVENRWPEFEHLLFEHRWEGSNIQRVKIGYTFAQGAFTGQPRKTGQEWQFSHGEHIAKKLVTEWEYRDPVVVVSGLNHDTAEDTAAFDPPINEILGDTLWPTNSEKREFAKRWITRVFDKDTARIVLALTRPEIDNVEVFSREQAQEMYIQQIKEAADMRVLVIKLEDNINNLEEPFDPKAHERKKDEIRAHFLPIYDKLLISRHKIEAAERRLIKLHELLEPAH
jgi:(p)ppGpp synthase/HD superfamily hydrolase